MDNDLGLLLEYESILCGEQKDFTSTYIKKDTTVKDVACLFHFLFEEILGWSPEEVETYTSPELIEKMHLSRAVKKIKFPPELKNTDLFYIACILYPSSVKMEKKAVILAVYKKVLSGRLKKFPKNFFYLADSESYLFNCLNYAINEKLYFENIKDVYSFFYDREKAEAFLSDVRLLTPCNDNYDYPLDMVHDFLNMEQADDTYYSFYRLKTLLQEGEGKTDHED